MLVTYRHILKAHSHYEVGRPVAETSHSDSRRPRALTEQLSYDEPRDGAWSNFKECHKGKNSNNAHV